MAAPFDESEVWQNSTLPLRRRAIDSYWDRITLILVTAILVIGPSATMCEAEVTANILNRVFQIRSGDSTGTAFTLEINDKQYLITAKHVVPDLDADAGGQILVRASKENWSAVHVRPIYPSNVAIDIVALAPASQVSVTFPITLVGSGLLLSQEVYFLGYPFGMGMFQPGWLPVPFVKRGIVASFDADMNGFWIDGINNPGFSGGPVVAVKPSGEHIVVGVVSAYRNAREPVYTATERTPSPTNAYVLANAGLVLAYWINPILDAIKSHEIGAPVSTATPTPVTRPSLTPASTS